MIHRFIAGGELLLGIGCLFIFIMFRRLLLKQKAIVCQTHSSAYHAVITGATSGIGRATAFDLARRKWRLTLGCRDLEAGVRLRRDIMSSTGNSLIKVNWLDLLQPSSILRFVEDLSPTDVLINNAGVMPSTCREASQFGDVPVEVATNYLGHYYLTNLLITYQKWNDQKTDCSYPRIVIVCSSLASKGSISNLFLPALSVRHAWKSMQAYANSKLACCLFARELHRRFGSPSESNVQPIGVYCLFTGGMVNTSLNRELLSNYPSLLRGLFRLLSRAILKTPEQGCQTVVHCSVSEAVDDDHSITNATSNVEELLTGGRLYSNCAQINWPASACDMQQAEQLWQQTLNFLQQQCGLSL